MNHPSISSEAATGAIYTKEGARVVVDFDLLPDLEALHWRLNSQGYPCNSVGSKFVYLHRLVATLASGTISKGLQIHHSNDNRLDARRSNLEALTAQEHRERHRSRGPRPGQLYKGVCFRPFHSKARPYYPMVKINWKQHWGVGYATPEEAAHAYDQMIEQLNLPHAYKNFSTN